MSFFFGGWGGNMSSRIPLSPLLVSKKEKEKDSNNIQFKNKKKLNFILRIKRIREYAI